MSAEATANPVEEKPKGSKKKLLLIVAVVVLLAGAGGGWWWWSHSQAAAAETEGASHSEKTPAQYYALEPTFVVNLADPESVRYLQADIQLMTRDAETAAALETHAPAVRNQLLLLFGEQTSEQLAQRSAKVRLQEKALAEVKTVLKREGAPDKVEAVLFTSLVTQ